MSLDSCHSSDLFRTNLNTPLLQEVLYKHDEEIFLEMSTMKQEHIQDSICEFIMSSEYYKAEAWILNEKLKKIIHEKLKVETSNEPKCMMCLDRIQNIILKPCGHVGICHECYEKLEFNECPFCRKHVDRIVNLLDFYKANSTNIDWTQKLSIFPTAMMLQSFPKLQKTTQKKNRIQGFRIPKRKNSGFQNQIQELGIQIQELESGGGQIRKPGPDSKTRARFEN